MFRICLKQIPSSQILHARGKHHTAALQQCEQTATLTTSFAESNSKMKMTIYFVAITQLTILYQCHQLPVQLALSR